MPDPLRLEAEAWLIRAQDDLLAARKLISGNDPLTATAAYHCQQAAEKALKAVLAATAESIPKTHDLRLLMDRCLMTDASLADLRDACDELTPYATEFRYPTQIPDPTSSDIDDAIALSSAILEAATNSLRIRFADVR